ncbi:MAG: PEP-CTERM sorting domain-containing protein [Acidobacteria bacterium]|nr:PEP-CTERM sorting domain-containing protein [Acidobacteriota bacterium]
MGRGTHEGHIHADRSDRALTLEGTETPEPATFGSIGIALAAFRRRNRHVSA